MDRLKGKIAVVTGASKGIGAAMAMAEALGAEGASVVVNYASSREGADKVVKAITDKGGKAAAVQANVDQAADVERLFAATEKAFGPANVLVNNAGVYEYVPLDAVTEEQFHRHFNINVLGVLLASQAAARHFGEVGGSIIISARSKPRCSTRAPRCIRGPRVRWTRSLACWRTSWERRRSG